MEKFFIECGLQKSRVKFTKNNLISDDIYFTKDGKEAINKLLWYLNIERKDEVLIVSTFDTKYVSKCVTCSIFNHAKPSKVLSRKTKAIYAIHDHGFPLVSTLKLRRLANKMKIPLIEDCAHSVTSNYADKASVVGTESDYTIYSFRKVFPTSSGGVKFNNKDEFIEFSKKVLIKPSQEVFWHLSKSLKYHEQRIANYSLLIELTKEKTQVFRAISPHTSPYCFSIIHPNPTLFRNLFNRENEHIFECVSWYGLPIVSFPCHQLIPRSKIINLAELINKTAKKYTDENMD